MNQLYLKPNPDLKVALREHPADQALPKEGGWRPETSFWLRRLRDKDVTLAEPPAATGGEAAKDPVAELLAGTVAAVKAGVGELSDAALADAIAREKAAPTPRTQVINAIQAEIDRRAGNK